MPQNDIEGPVQTNKLTADQRQTVVIPGLGTFDTRFTGRSATYHPLPSNYMLIQHPAFWRIVLRFGAPAPRVTVGLDIYADVVMGRGQSSTGNLDIDLTNLDALELGVSRRHAMLRPTQNHLYVIDLQSTNGTYVNAIPVSRGMAQTLRSGDAISLAGLNFVVEIIASPTSDVAQQAAVSGAGEYEEGAPAPLTPKRDDASRKTVPPGQMSALRSVFPDAAVGPQTKPMNPNRDLKPDSDDQSMGVFGPQPKDKS